MTEEVRHIVADLRTRLQPLYGERLVKLVLFGSQARGDAVPGSDIDVLVVLRGPVSAVREIERVGGITSAVSLKHGVTISCVFVSTSRYAHENSPLLMNVRREGIPA